MALIKCPECQRDVSDKAAACPNCGAPPLPGDTTKAAEEISPKIDFEELGLMACGGCHQRVKPKVVTPGSGGITFVLFLFLIIPGIIYEIWRGSARYKACPLCASKDLVPVESPRARTFLPPLSSDEKKKFSPKPAAPLPTAVVPLAVFTLLAGLIYIAAKPTAHPPTQVAPSLQSNKGSGRANADVASVPYRILKEWPVPNGGFGRVILIDPKFRNEKSIRLLGETIRRDTRNDRNVFDDFYDSERAAGMRGSPPDENTADGKFYNRHSIGSYIRNINTGIEELIFLPKGIHGPTIEVHYR